MTMPQDTKSVVAVVLAGGSSDDALAVQAGVEAKALLPLAGKPMGSYVLEALRASSLVSACIYVGETTPAVAALATHCVPAGRTLADSLALGLGAALTEVKEGQRLLVVTADLPWLNTEALDHFISASPSADLVYPIISQAVAKEQFPQQKRTYVRLKEGKFTGGNLILLKSQIIPSLLPFINRVYHSRKNPFALAALVGFSVLVKFLLGRASLSELEQRVGQMLAAPVQAFVTPFASLGADVDKPSHLEAEFKQPLSEV